MNFADSLSVLKMEMLQNAVPQLLDLLSRGISEGQPVHEVEGSLWDWALRVGRQ